MLTIDAVDPASGELTAQPMPVAEMTAWQPLPGADAVRIVLRDGGDPIFHAEVSVAPGLLLTIEARQTGEGWEVASAGGRVLLPLRLDTIARPSLLRVRPDTPVDVFFLLDGTALQPLNGSQFEPLLSSAAWKHVREQLDRFRASLGGPGLRTGVGAFGDESLTGKPSGYVLHPARWTLGTVEQAERDWNELRPADGGDFVDALADGLHRCRSLAWAGGARKLLVIFGESPGYSVMHACRRELALADGQLRKFDVDEEAAALHEAGVEIVTIFHGAAAELLRESTSFSRELLDYAREQYTRLASLPAWSVTAPGWDPARLASNWKSWTGLVARGAVPPLKP